ncbi:MAG: Gmad2 immunoglobulin-like domain-containing protein [Actinomycetes bacterium]
MSIRLAHAALAAVVVISAAGCAPTTPGQAPSGSASPPAPSATASGSAPATGSPATGAPSASPTASEQTQPQVVYFPRDASNGVRLGREMRLVPQDDPLRGVLEVMIEGPIDVDYISGWPEGTRVLSASTQGSVTTVDLSAEARTTTLGSEAASAQADQLLWTVTELVGETTAVDLRIEGQPAGELWGVLSWDGPRLRGDPFSARVLVSIDTPLDGSLVSSPVVVTGDAAVFEANLPWRVLDEGGSVVQQGFTTTEEGQRFAAYRFEVELDPGRYTIEIREDDPSDGEGRRPDVDTRTVEVGGS